MCNIVLCWDRCFVECMSCFQCVEKFFFFVHVVTFLCFVAVRRVPPRFSIPPTSHEIMPGGSVNITCVAVGSPMPYVKWMLGAEDLTPEDDMPIGRNVLELNNVRESANYTCVAMSTLGVIEAFSEVTVKGELYLQKLPWTSKFAKRCVIFTWCMAFLWSIIQFWIVFLGYWNKNNKF